MDTPHQGRAQRIAQYRGGQFTGWLYVASCTGCEWLSTDAVTFDYARATAARHMSEHPPPTPPAAAEPINTPPAPAGWGPEYPT